MARSIRQQLSALQGLPDLWLMFFVVLTCSAFLWWNAGTLIAINNNDEGIYFDGALRTLGGEVVYRDFFALTGPGTFWLHALALEVFGISVGSARLPVVMDMALVTGLVFLLTTMLAGRIAGLIAASLYFGFQPLYHTYMLANHRWDSGSLAFACLAILVGLLSNQSRILAFILGVSSVLAVWITPTMVLVSCAILAWLVWDSRLRPTLLPFMLGSASCAVAGVIWLQYHSAFLPMVRQFFWTGGNYSAANWTSYGWIIGGYGSLFRGAGIGDVAAKLIVLLFLTLPATLPPICFVGWPLWLRKNWRGGRDLARPVGILLCGGAAMVASTWPRPDLVHLMYVFPVFFVLTFGLGVRIFHRTMQLLLVGLATVVSCAGIAHAVRQRADQISLRTPAGIVRGSPNSLAAIDAVISRVKPGNSLFVFPYDPIFYFLTRAANPTRFSFLQPGMFTIHDEIQALESLEANPPKWVIYTELDPDSYLRIWPSSDPARLRMPSIEQFIHSRYRQVTEAGQYRLMLRKNIAE